VLGFRLILDAGAGHAADDEMVILRGRALICDFNT
jgi:hypothetical protein